MLTLIEDQSSDYKNRTEVNARDADVTIAIALLPNSLGETLTRNMAKKHNRLFISVSPLDDVDVKSSEISDTLSKLFMDKAFKINIAGNGLKTMQGKFTQKQCDEFTLSLMRLILQKNKLNVELIRSGGQTGFDEAGIKASLTLGIKTIGYYPKGFKIMHMSGSKYQKRSEVEALYKPYITSQ